MEEEIRKEIPWLPEWKYFVSNLWRVKNWKVKCRKWRILKFEHIINMARLRVENHYELDLRHKGSTGSIFALKNFGWKGKTEQEISGDLVKKVFVTQSDIKEFDKTINDVLNEWWR